MKFQDLRKKYPRFIYEDYFYKISEDNLEIFFDFKLEEDKSSSRPFAAAREIEPDIHFKPKIVIENIDKSQIKKVKGRVLDNLIFNLGLIEMLSYWKATCSPEILIKTGHLNKEQINWWKDLIIKGMGQFFYENKINFKKPNNVDIRCPQVLDIRCPTLTLKNRCLVPMGGGKDSIVTLKLLKKAKKDIQCFSLNPTEATLKIMKISGCRNPIIVRREIDEKLLELNRKGFLNGHTPFSAYLAFLSFLAAAISGQKYIALSNERSSNEGNVRYLGSIINHQWSKSFEFEQKFRKYSKKYLSSSVEYFSFLRPLYEIQIAKLFSKYPKYFNVFLSCNEAYKTTSGIKKPTGKWCGNCSKCLFVFTVLYPFIDEQKLIKIFGENLFEKKKLLPIMQQLIGERGFKPFECVGAKKESLAAFYLSYKKYIGVTYGKLPFLLKYFEDKILNSLPPRFSSVSKRFLRDWNNQHNLPKEFEKILRKVP